MLVAFFLLLFISSSPQLTLTHTEADKQSNKWINTYAHTHAHIPPSSNTIPFHFNGILNVSKFEMSLRLFSPLLICAMKKKPNVYLHCHTHTINVYIRCVTMIEIGQTKWMKGEKKTQIASDTSTLFCICIFYKQVRIIHATHT